MALLVLKGILKRCYLLLRAPSGAKATGPLPVLGGGLFLCLISLP